MLKQIQKSIGAPLTALLIALAIFMLPKIIKDDYGLYKEIKQSMQAHR